ncbi:hypothetical protein D030_2660A, partial [Vibrio parahaemolyticus AQ3810]
MAYYYI